jgi:TIR domain
MYGLAPELETLFFRMQVVIGKGAGCNWQEHRIGDKSCLSLFVLNFIDGVRHRVFLVPQLSLVDANTIVHHMPGILEELAKVHMSTSAGLDRFNPLESSNDLPFSNRLFFFTDCLRSGREELSACAPRDVVVIIDDGEWKRRIDMRKPDAFIAHDSRDKNDLARPLAHQLGRLALVVWFDEFSLRPGDRLSESIDRGLTECRHAILLVTKNLLENKTWASTEMSALMTRAVDERNVLIPVWSGVDTASVKARSARLADIVAIRYTGNVEELASRLYATVGGSGL